jgi:4-hydroxy-3-methylbut-2-enyl diphosphate reductase IspH
VQGADDIDTQWLADASVVGLTAGSSTPDYVIDEVEQKLITM